METIFGRDKVLLVLAILVGAPAAAAAQTTDTPTAPPAQSQPAQSQPVQPEVSQPLLKPEQLEALVAPIALYPDELLTNVLAASTYPLEAVQADRWVKANKNLKGDALKAAVDKQAWDGSVKALASTPDVLAMMSDKLDWTKNLADAVLAQQADVMDAVQRLRAKAQARNKLVTNKQQKISVQRQDNNEVIVIEQAQPDMMYVPYYDPATVYGEWPYAEYPPTYFGYPSYIGAGVVAAGLAFGAGWAIGRWGNYWGGGCNWGSRNLYVNHYNRIDTAGSNWQHNPAHRQGVKYNNANVANRFGNNNPKAGVGDRGGDRVGTRDKSGGNRAGAGGDRGNQPSAADRSKGGGDRAKGGNRSGGSVAAKRTGSGGARGNVSPGRAANVHPARGQASLGGRGGHVGRCGFAGRGGGGGFHGGGGGGFRGGGGGQGGDGGRRSDIALKHDIMASVVIASAISAAARPMSG